MSAAIGEAVVAFKNMSEELREAAKDLEALRTQARIEIPLDGPEEQWPLDNYVAQAWISAKRRFRCACKAYSEAFKTLEEAVEKK